MNRNQLHSFITQNKYEAVYLQFVRNVLTDIRAMMGSSPEEDGLSYIPIDWSSPVLQSIMAARWSTSVPILTPPEKLYMLVRGSLLEVISYLRMTQTRWTFQLDYKPLFSTERYKDSRLTEFHHLVRYTDGLITAVNFSDYQPKRKTLVVSAEGKPMAAPGSTFYRISSGFVMTPEQILHMCDPDLRQVFGILSDQQYL